ncbi:hypothetical protein IMZ08_11075 [Bacillus luteolus]|uniref:Uncharacterized protein n=1 Tax=Litchfieldia luteola TaxID=682179 RepID=A0ABR9QJC6_9BACI|nr:hypothetical protein [Cytobacillus luteolus]MBE4908599.1 hypothetical protein [Cytobacillus luteolus]MBP1941454.1 hypothetical protein [Cytobacillus luteolus]
MQKLNPRNFIYEATVSPSEHNNEFALELFDYSSNLECSGEPCKKISTFDELLLIIDELEDEKDVQPR